MTNQEIILRTAAASGIFEPSFIEACITSGHMLPFHTYKVWQDLGYQVKKGEKGFPIVIWNARTKKAADAGSDDIPEDEEERKQGGFYQHKAFFFKLDQCEKIKKEVV